MPAKRIGLDVISDAGQGIFHPDDVLVIIPLPDTVAGTAAPLVDAPGRESFESSDYLRQSMALRKRRRIGIENENAVDVIWHNHECVRFEVRIMRWQRMPGCFNNFTKGVQIHRFFNDVE